MGGFSFWQSILVLFALTGTVVIMGLIIRGIIAASGQQRHPPRLAVKPRRPGGAS